MKGSLSNVVAGCFAMAAFAVAIISGIVGDNPASSVLFRALLALVFCYPVGLIIGLICQYVVDQEVKRVEEENPLPGLREPDGSETEAAASGSMEDEEVLTV